MASIAIAGTALACGDDDDDEGNGGETPASATTTKVAISAQEMLPELEDIGFTLTQSGKDPGQAGFDSAVALYKGSGAPQQQLQVRIYVLPSEEAATTQFNAFAQALRNPPPEFLGGIQAKFVDASSPDIGDARKSYKTDRPDSQGYTAYTDVYRKGRTVVLTQVVDTAPEGMPARKAAGERALSEAP